MIRLSDILMAKMLIVDDLEANVAVLEQMLREAGYVGVTSTRDPREVAELHRQNRYDLVLLDLQMPGLDGFQVMTALKEVEPDGFLPILVVTAEPNHKLRALRAGARDFLSKPFELAEVLARVHNLLEIRLLHRSETLLNVARLEKSEERFKFVARAVSDGIWDWNLLANTVWWNDGFLTAFGFAAAEIAPTVESWNGRIHPADRRWVAKSIQKAIESGADTWNAEYGFRHKDGSHTLVQNRGHIIRDPAGKAVRMVGGMRHVAA